MEQNLNSIGVLFQRRLSFGGFHEQRPFILVYRPDLIDSGGVADFQPILFDCLEGLEFFLDFVGVEGGDLFVELGVGEDVIGFEGFPAKGAGFLLHLVGGFLDTVLAEDVGALFEGDGLVVDGEADGAGVIFADFVVHGNKKIYLNARVCIQIGEPTDITILSNLLLSPYSIKIISFSGLFPSTMADRLMHIVLSFNPNLPLDRLTHIHPHHPSQQVTIFTITYPIQHHSSTIFPFLYTCSFILPSA